MGEGPAGGLCCLQSLKLCTTGVVAVSISVESLNTCSCACWNSDARCLNALVFVPWLRLLCLYPRFVLLNSMLCVEGNAARLSSI